MTWKSVPKTDIPSKSKMSYLNCLVSDLLRLAMVVTLAIIDDIGMEGNALGLPK